MINCEQDEIIVREGGREGERECSSEEGRRGE